jgi:uncharacterized membrane protein YhiD involved in acid resistance
MNTAKKMLVVGAITTVVGAGAFAGVASAQTSSSTGGQSLADKIAQKFNLNKNDVQQVIDENRMEHQADHQKQFENRLNQAVTDGKITAAQKDQILAKAQELKTYMDSIKDKTADEKRTLMKTKIDELKQWAKDNNLTQYMPMMGMGGRGHHGGMMRGDAAQPDVSQPDNASN